MQIVLWEQTANGIPAQLKKSQQPITKSNFMLKRIALSKMTDVTLLSADFQGNVVLFEPRVSILLDKSSQVEFRGLYQIHVDRKEPQETPVQALPSLALRQAIWRRDDDFKHFNRAAHKRAYIEGPQQVQSKITFTTPELQPEMYQLLEDARNLVRTGLKMEPVPIPNYQREEVRFCVDDEELRFILLYLPQLRQSLALDGWIEQWIQSFARVDFSGGSIPDHGCSISYAHSLMDLLSRFPGEENMGVENSGNIS